MIIRRRRYFFRKKSRKRRALSSWGDQFRIDAEESVVFAVVVVPELGVVGGVADAELDGFRWIVVFRDWSGEFERIRPEINDKKRIEYVGIMMVSS